MAQYQPDEFDRPPRSGRRGAHRRAGGPRSQAGAIALISVLALVAVLLLVGVFRIIGAGTSDPEDKAAQDNPGVESSAPASKEESAPAAVEKTAEVEVYNGSGKSGVATKYGDAIKADGWKVSKVGNHRTTSSTSTVFYADAQFKDQATALAKSLGIEAVEESSEFTADIAVVICSDIAGQEPKLSSPTS